MSCILNIEGEKLKKHSLQKGHSLKQRVSYTLTVRLSSIQHAGEARQGNKLGN
jgi:hypothetical protein